MRLTLLVLLLLFVPARGRSAEPSPPREGSWVSSADLANRLTPWPPLSFSSSTDWSPPATEVDPERRFQTMTGLGSSLEPTTAQNLSLLPAPLRREVLTRLVDPLEGLGMNLMRLCVGTPDFTGDDWYSYDDVPAGQADEPLAHFSIAKDERYLLPAILEARARNPRLRFFASAWSPPAWMKSGGSLVGGSLLPRYYEAYARYLTRFVLAYEARGVPILALTVQNEPGVDRAAQPSLGYPSCRWTAEQERAFIRVLGPTLRQAGLRTEIWTYDHNFNILAGPEDPGLAYPTAVLSDPDASRYVAAVAFHGYVGEPSAMSVFHDRFPSTPIRVTEHSLFGIDGMLTLIQYLKNWASSYDAWVTLTDEAHGPNRGPFTAGDTIVMLDRSTGRVRYSPDYYFYGQFMRFVDLGAVRVASTDLSYRAPTVAFRNPDGRLVLIVVNGTGHPLKFLVSFEGKAAPALLPAESIGTYVWAPPA